MNNDPLDIIIQALQNLPTFSIYTISNIGTPIPWMEVSGVDIANELVIREHTLATQIQSIGIKIMEWGRLVARCQRVLDIQNRLYRSWKANLIKEKIEAGDKLTEKAMEAIYRSNEKYDTWNESIEEYAENLACAQAVLDGFRAKKDALRFSVRPAHESYNPQFTIP